MISELKGRGSLCISARPSCVVHNERRAAETSEDGGQDTGTHTTRWWLRMGWGDANWHERRNAHSFADDGRAPVVVENLSRSCPSLLPFPLILLASPPLHFRQNVDNPLDVSTMKQMKAVVDWHIQHKTGKKDAIWRRNDVMCCYRFSWTTVGSTLSSIFPPPVAETTRVCFDFLRSEVPDQKWGRKKGTNQIGVHGRPCRLMGERKYSRGRKNSSE